MAYKDFSAGTGGQHPGADAHETRIHATAGHAIDLPDATFIRDAAMTREGMDLILKGPHGAIIIEGYFAAEPAPLLSSPDGSHLTPELVESFAKSAPQYAANQTANDASPVGTVKEVTGHATVQHADGSIDTLVKGAQIFEGDVIQTEKHGAVNIQFQDQTTFAVSEDARLSIDKYVYDPATQSGTNDFSILKGLFVFTSGLIGRDDPDDVHIHTPAGSIGIRGTVIAGNVTTGEITVVEGAIVLHDAAGHETTLASQFETARFSNGNIEHIGQLSASDVSSRFSSVSTVSPGLFSSINDAAHQPAPAAHDANHDAAPAAQHGADHQSMAAPDAAAPARAGLAENASGFGNTSGFAPSAATFDPSAPAASSAPPAFSANSTANAGAFAANPPAVIILPPPSPSSSTTNATSDANTTTAVNSIATQPQLVPPVGLHAIPPEYFSTAQGVQWKVDFSKDFSDPAHPNVAGNMTYELGAATIAQLNSWTYDGAGTGGPDILQSGPGQGVIGAAGNAGHGWTFDSSTGVLTFFTSATFDTSMAANSFAQLGVDVKATDGADGASSSFIHYDFNAYNAVTVFSGTFNVNVANSVFAQSAATTSATTNTISGEHDKFFLASTHGDTIIFQNAGAGVTGLGNELHLSDAGNAVVLADNTYDNLIFGGAGNDDFTLATTRIHAFGGAGDDSFIIDFANGSVNIPNELSSTANNMLIDGGSSNFNAGALLQGLGLNTSGATGGHGDTIAFNGAGSLDFGLINTAGNKITGIERIDAASDAGAQHITLHYQDILNITDDRHTLVINVGAGDTLDLSGSQLGLGNMHLVQSNLLVNDATQGAAAVNQHYDVYSDGHVTLLIHDDSAGGAIVHMDGTSVTAAH